MKVVITGGLGFLGVKLAQRLLEKKTLAGLDGTQKQIHKLVLFDVARTNTPLASDPRVEIVTGDISDKATVEKLIDTDDISVFHLGSVLSGQGEEDFDLAISVNLDGTRNLLECIRKRGNPKIRLLFTSTCAIFDAQDLVTDATRLLPQTTYGMTKACSELLICDYSRRRFLDGRIARLPTVIVRPGVPNKAASTFCSSMFREPLNGVAMEVPVPEDTAIFLIGYPAVIENLVIVHELEPNRFGYDRTSILPGFCATVKEMIESLHRVAKEVFPDKKLGKIVISPDPVIETIVKSWPKDGHSKNAENLGLIVDANIDGIVKQYIKDFVNK